jgi:hypothetical protein
LLSNKVVLLVQALPLVVLLAAQLVLVLQLQALLWLA